MIGIEVTGIEQVREKLRFLGNNRIAQKTSMEVAKFLRGEFMKYPPPRYVTRAAAYGSSFFTDRQRRWFFAALGRGELKIPYRRTRATMMGWEVMPFGARDAIVVNDTEGAKWTMDDQTQTRHEAMVGWQRVKAIVNKNRDRIRQIAGRAVDAYIRSGGR